MSPPPPPIEPGVRKCAECWLRAWEDAHFITSPIGLDEGRLLIPNGHTGPGRPQPPWRPAESWASSTGHHVDGDRGSPEQLAGRGDTWQETVDWSGRVPSRIFQLAADREQPIKYDDEDRDAKPRGEQQEWQLRNARVVVV